MIPSIILCRLRSFLKFFELSRPPTFLLFISFLSLLEGEIAIPSCLEACGGDFGTDEEGQEKFGDFK